MKTGDQFNPYKIFNGCYIPFSLMECTELSSSAKLVYARLTAYAGQDGLAFPKHETLAKDLGFKSRNSVIVALKELVKFKLIEPTKAEGKDRLFHKSNQYRFLWNDLLIDSLKSQNHISNTINSTEVNILTSGSQNHIPPDVKMLTSESQDVDFLYKDEKNHIEKNHKEIKNSTYNEVLQENKKFSCPPSQNVPYEKIVKIYHEKLPQLPKVEVISNTRKAKLKTCWSQKATEHFKPQDLVWWQDYFEYVGRVPFLLGENNKGWRANFDFLINLNSLVKVMEGVYEGGNNVPF